MVSLSIVWLPCTLLAIWAPHGPQFPNTKPILKVKGGQKLLAQDLKACLKEEAKKYLEQGQAGSSPRGSPMEPLCVPGPVLGSGDKVENNTQSPSSSSLERSWGKGPGSCCDMLTERPSWGSQAHGDVCE